MVELSLALDAERVLTGLSRLTNATEPLREAVRDLGDGYKLALMDATPVGRGEKPGRTKASYKTQERYGPQSAEYTITNNAASMPFVLNGRGPVVAKPGKMLRFVQDGEVIFRKRVGPAKANNFPERVKAQMAGKVHAAGERAAGLIIREYGQ